MQITALLSLLLLLIASARSGPTRSRSQDGDLPVIDLPHGSFRAARYNKANDVYVFKNIPYAAPPVGDLRWSKPAPPLNQSGVQNGNYGPSCPQSIPRGINFVGPGNQSPIGSAVNQFIGGIPIPDFADTSEDCLYLDLYVPSRAIDSPTDKLPVAVFVYGGGYIMGSKDVYQPHLPFYDGSGLVTQSQGDLIFVTFNYRLGAYGFLAGTTMERDGLPNAGLWDQRAAFQWVKDNIGAFGGDGGSITAIGESAGAGSIVHHLVARGGQLDPLFDKAVVLSPAFQPIWDRAGMVEDTFKRFERLAGCGEGGGLACLRQADPDVLASANEELMRTHSPAGSFAVGPTPDGDFVRQLPALELATGNFWELESMVLSHCANEATLFVNGAVATNADFDSFIGGIFPQYARENGILDHVTRRMYPPVGGEEEASSTEAGTSSERRRAETTRRPLFKTQAARTEAVLRDSSFTCSIRYLNEAMGDDRVWNLQYSVSPGWHASDLFAVFYNSRFSSGDWTQVLSAFVRVSTGIVFSGISWALQSYLTSYAITGDPNERRATWNVPPAIRWGHPDSGLGMGEKISGVLNVGNWFYSTVDDGEVPRTECDFWREFASAVTVTGGYLPPGSEVVHQQLVDLDGYDEDKMSARFGRQELQSGFVEGRRL